MSQIVHNEGMRDNATAIRRVFETVSLGAPERAVGFVLWQVVHRYLREMDRALASLELTHLQFMTLAFTGWLEKSGDPITQTDIAKRSDMHPMQVSLMLKALEKKRLVVRTRSKDDVRAKHLRLTREGVSILRKAFPLAIGVQKNLFGPLADQDGDFLKTLLRLSAGNPEPDRAAE